MHSVRLHLDGKGVLWLLAKCSHCGEVHKYPAAEAARGAVPCKSCRVRLTLEGAVLDPPSTEGGVDAS